MIILEYDGITYSIKSIQQSIHYIPHLGKYVENVEMRLEIQNNKNNEYEIEFKDIQDRFGIDLSKIKKMELIGDYPYSFTLVSDYYS